LGRRTISSNTVWCVSQPRQRPLGRGIRRSERPQRRRWLGRSLVAKHPLIPSLAREPVSLLAGFLSPLSGSPDGRAVNAFARLGAHGRQNALCGSKSASRYGSRWIIVLALVAAGRLLQGDLGDRRLAQTNDTTPESITRRISIGAHEGYRHNHLQPLR
jgi:hypothetical protein